MSRLRAEYAQQFTRIEWVKEYRGPNRPDYHCILETQNGVWRWYDKTMSTPMSRATDQGGDIIAKLSMWERLKAALS